MRIVFLVLFFTFSLYAKDAKSEFMKMCMNPTDSQKITLKVVFKKLYLKTTENFCEKIASYHIKTKKNPSVLESLTISDQNITDVSPLIHFTNLRRLNIHRNNIKDISVLEKLTKLEELDISDNPIEDISAIAKLKKLKRFSMGKVPGNIDVLKDSITIEHLKMGGFDRKISVVENLVNLKSIMLSRNKLIDICTLKGLIKLKRISAVHSRIKDIDCLKNLKEIHTLSLAYNPIKDISVLRNFQSLQAISMQNTQVEDISILKYTKKLESLNISDTKVKDASVLSGRRMNFQAENTPLVSCSPKTYEDLLAGKSCYEKDGTLKPWYKRIF